MTAIFIWITEAYACSMANRLGKKFIAAFAALLIAGLVAVVPVRADLLDKAQSASEDPGRDMQAAPASKPAPALAPAGTVEPLTILVSDSAKALDAAALKTLKASVTASAAKTGVRFDVLIVPSLKHERPDFAAATAAGAHDLVEGRDAVLVLLAVQEKKGWIWTSSGLVTQISPGMKQAIIDYILMPNMKQGNIARAAEDSTRAIVLALRAASGRVQVADESPATEIIPSGFLPTLIGGVFLTLLMGSAGWYSAPLVLFRRV